MQVTVNYLAILSSVTGKDMEQLELKKGTKIAELISILSQKYGPRFEDIVYMNASSRKYLVNFLLDNISVDDDYELEDGDELKILLALGGG